MTRKSDNLGPPDLTTPIETKKILSLAKANKNDIFYDLGCGHGGVCIIAARKVKRAVGIEKYKTYRETVNRVNIQMFRTRW